MSTRDCPFCGETIQAAAVKCRFCKEALDGGGTGAPPAGKGGTSALVIILVAVGACIVLGGFVSIVAAIAIPNLIEARKSGNESAAIGGLKAIASAETLHSQSDPDRNGKQEYGSLQQLTKDTYIDPVLGSGRKSGYLFTIGTPPPGSPESEVYWAGAASPIAPGTTGGRFFGVDQSGQLFWSPTTPFTVDGGMLGKPADARILGR